MAVNANQPNSSFDRSGWTIGGGIETHLGDGWTGKLEYLYLDFGSITDFATTTPPPNPFFRYGDSPRERIDLFLAANPKAPTVAFIHGGYWQANDKENFAFFAEGLLPLGINLAVIEYTLASTARLDHIVAEIYRTGSANILANTEQTQAVSTSPAIRPAVIPYARDRTNRGHTTRNPLSAPGDPPTPSSGRPQGRMSA